MTKESSDNTIIEGKWYPFFLADVKARIKSAQYEALRAVNKELITLYWDLGRLIVERQKEAGWGKAVVVRLAHDLQVEFPGVRGFSDQNLWRMRRFYGAYALDAKLSPLVIELSWSHNLVILTSCKDELEREFYLRMTKHHGWSKNVLIHQIEAGAYFKTLSAQTNFDQTLSPDIRDRAKLTVKGEYTL